MDIVMIALFIVGGIVVIGSLFGVDDLIKHAIDAKVKIAQERRLEAEARAEEARIKNNSTHTN